MDHVRAGFGFDVVFGSQFSFGIKNFVAAAAGDGEGAFVAVEGDEVMFLVCARVAGTAFPREANFAEIVLGDGGVGCFLVVIEMITAAVAGHFCGVRDLESPSGDVQGVDAVVPEFAVAPMPAPMPIVMEEIIDVRALGGGALPKVIVEVRG